MKIGFMQGRLSPLVNNRIQAFPWDSWESEFALAKKLGFGLMEWTIDHENLYQNPLMIPVGRERIRSLSLDFDLLIPSLTGDCFMQAPFWKAAPEDFDRLVMDFLNVVEACSLTGIGIIVIPLVDNGSLTKPEEETLLIETLKPLATKIKSSGIKIVFESDFPPKRLVAFINRFPTDVFGINYDMGNSAALGFDPEEEFKAYGPRIWNVHVKDRKLGGTTVPLGTGNVSFEKVFTQLKKNGYCGNYILQTARSPEGLHSEVLTNYREMTLEWIGRHGS